MTDQNNSGQEPQQGQPPKPPEQGQPPQQWQPPQQPQPGQPPQQPQQWQPPQGQPPQPYPAPQQYQQQPYDAGQVPPQYPGAPMPMYPNQQVQPQPLTPIEGKQHVHHSYIWLSSIRMAFFIFVIVFATSIGLIFDNEVVELAGRAFGSTALYGLLLLVLFVIGMGIAAGIYVLSYKNLYYELGDEEFNLYSGILSKKRVHIPYQRIQSVNQNASLFQRIFGVCTVNIDTAGGAANKAVMIPYLQNQEAERLRGELFARKQAILNQGEATKAQAAAQAQAAAVPGQNVLDMPANIMHDVRGVFGGAAVDTGAVTYEYGMSNKELIFTGLANSTAGILILVALIAGGASLVESLLQTAIGQMAYSEGIGIASRLFGNNLVVAAIVGSLGFVLFVWILSIAASCVSYGGFKARRRQSRIEVEHGLLQHRFQGVDIDRVQSVIIKQGVIRRMFGYCELSFGKIDALTPEEQQNSGLQKPGLVVHPFVKMNRVPEILAGLAPEFADVPVEQKALPKVSLRRGLIRRCILHGSGFWLAIGVTLAYAITKLSLSNEAAIQEILPYVDTVAYFFYAFCLVILIVEIVGTFMWFRGSSFAYNKNFMQITNGGYSRESVSFPRKKIQYGMVKTNPFQRYSKVATVMARTAAGVGGTSMRLLDVREDDAHQWLDWVKPHGNVVK